MEKEKVIPEIVKEDVINKGKFTIVILTDITGECSVTVSTYPTATDNCEGVLSGSPDVSFPVTAQGTTIVIWTYDDGNGNTSQQTQNIIIEDITNPTIECVPNQIVNADDPTNTYTVPT